MKIKIFNNIVYIFTIIYQFIFSQVNLPCLIGDGMVLQRDAEVKLWGWAAPDERVTIKLNNKIYHRKNQRQKLNSVHLRIRTGPYIFSKITESVLI
jgi:hypothetical protein